MSSMADQTSNTKPKEIYTKQNDTHDFIIRCIRKARAELPSDQENLSFSTDLEDTFVNNDDDSVPSLDSDDGTNTRGKKNAAELHLSRTNYRLSDEAMLYNKTPPSPSDDEDQLSLLSYMEFSLDTSSSEDSISFSNTTLESNWDDNSFSLASFQDETLDDTSHYSEGNLDDEASTTFDNLSAPPA
jgi:hypothetical protein